jgi:hypothetical protein
MLVTRFTSLAGLDPAIHAAVQAAALEAETKCHATERSAWRHRVDARIKSGQGELGNQVPFYTPTIKKLREKNKSFLVLFCKKELLPSCPT